MSQVISREVFIPHQQGRCVFPGFVAYISAAEPVLMHRWGWVDASDTYDDFVDCISTDNGRNWSPPTSALRGWDAPEGRWRYAENAAFFDSQTRQLLTFTTLALYSREHTVSHNRWCLQFNCYDTDHARWGQPWRTTMGFDIGLMLSFSHPIQTRSGAILVPVQKHMSDQRGLRIFKPGYWTPMLESLVLIGQRQPDGQLTWSPGQRVSISDELSSRGLCEPAIAQLLDGRIAMICRGDNGYFPEKPGYKWLSFSSDEGRNWTQPVPLTLSDSTHIESGANGSALFRSSKNGKLYWMGNLAMDGQRAKGNRPRYPLVLAQVQEEPFGLIRDSLSIIDTRQTGESDSVQMSNFRYYQDRLTGELVIFLTRFGEQDPNNFKLANYYRYRVELGN